MPPPPGRTGSIIVTSQPLGTGAVASWCHILRVLPALCLSQFCNVKISHMIWTYFFLHSLCYKHNGVTFNLFSFLLQTLYYLNCSLRQVSFGARKEILWEDSYQGWGTCHKAFIGFSSHSLSFENLHPTDYSFWENGQFVWEGFSALISISFFLPGCGGSQRAWVVLNCAGRRVTFDADSAAPLYTISDASFGRDPSSLLSV